MTATVNIYSGEDFIHKEDIEDYYKDGYAVMDVTFKEGNTAKSTSSAIDELKPLQEIKAVLQEWRYRTSPYRKIWLVRCS